MSALLRRTSLRHLGRHPWQVGLTVAGVALGVAVVVAIDLANASAERAFELSATAVLGSATHQIVGGPQGLPEELYARLVLTSGAPPPGPRPAPPSRPIALATPGSPAMLAPVSSPCAPAENSSAVSLGPRGGTSLPAPAGPAPALAPIVPIAPVAPIAPIIEEDVAVAMPAGHGLRVLHLLGVDPPSEAAFRGYLTQVQKVAATSGTSAAGAGGSGVLALLLTRPGACLLAARTASELRLVPGSRFALSIAGEAPRRFQAELVGLLSATSTEGGSHSEGGLADLLVTDIASAQEILGRRGTIDRIDLRLPEGSRAEALLDRLRLLLPPGAQILPAASRTTTARAMTRAFRINLKALSLLALVCGAFLIYNTMTFSVVRRRTELGILRALGVTRGQVLWLVLGEASLVALAGTAAGLAAGVLMGKGLVGLVARTINDLYFAVAVRELTLTAAPFAKGILLGLGATLLAALAPAVEAALAPPRAAFSRSLLETRLRRALPRATGLGAALLAAGACLLALPGLVLAFAALFAVVLGFALITPAATVLLMRQLRRPLGALLGSLGRMAAGGVEASLSRTGVAIAALVVAVSVTVGMGVMIDSFRRTVARWLESSLRADIYVAPAARRAGLRGATLDPALAGLAARVPGVALAGTIRRAEIPAAGGPVRLLAVGTGRRGFDGFELATGDQERAWRAFQSGAVLVSEPFSRRTGATAGSRLRLPTPEGEHDFRVAGVFYDYASDQGVVLVSRTTYLHLWHDPRLSAFSLDLTSSGAERQEEQAERAISRLRRALAAGAGEGRETQPLLIQSNGTLKRLSLAIFDRTFAITAVLRLIAGLVAAIGLLAALTALQLERGRELAVLRAMGLTPAQVWCLVTAQTGLMGLAAGLLSLPVGLALAAIMVYVVNRRSFGWSVRFEVAPQVLLGAVALALVAALAAGLYPAWRMSRAAPAAALREE